MSGNGFVRVQRRVRPRGRCSVALHRTGRIYITAAAVTEHFGLAKYVVLFAHLGDRKLGLMPVTGSIPKDAVVLSFSAQTGNNRAAQFGGDAVYSIWRELDFKPEVGVHYPATWEKDMLVVNFTTPLPKKGKMAYHDD